MNAPPQVAGELAIVLHTHMPYVEGFGTWPFGEEWLWEAVATSYLPLLDRVLGRAPITLSVTPVLADQLEQPEVIARCQAFLDELRPETHRRDAAELRGRGEERLAAEVERSGAEYAAAAEQLRALGPEGFLAALLRHATWTSAATHAVLPLLATDAGVSLQVQTGIESHRRRTGGWNGGFWLPECGHAPWLDAQLEQAGVAATCVELTSQFGLRHPRRLRPLITPDGPVLWPVDRATMQLLWSPEGYPAHGAYRDSHAFTTYRHHAWSNDGGAYDPGAAREQAAFDASDFVARTIQRVAGGGVCVCALDTELLGHWWYEGVIWLADVIDECARQGLRLTGLEEALERHEPNPVHEPLPVTSWGEGGDLRTWSAPRVAELAFAARTAELRVLAAGGPGVVPVRAVRELLALQSSDWAFLAYRGTAGDYPVLRARGHRELFERALAQDGELRPSLRGLAPGL